MFNRLMPSIREEMLRAAAQSLPGDVAAGAADFLKARVNPDGGFADRLGRSDLYYTVFGLEGLLALGAEIPARAVMGFLRRFGDGTGLDFVHLCCLARCWADLPGFDVGADVGEGILARIETSRRPDGGYSHVPGAEDGSAYGCFLALGAYQDLQADVPDRDGLAACLGQLGMGDGSFANDRRLPIASTPATAAAVTALRHLGQAADGASGNWLLACRCRQGGFPVTPGAPQPDLLATAVTLHALAGIGRPLDGVRRKCLEFVRGLRVDEGGFSGGPDDAPDCEYTFYGLLALGRLS